MQAGCRACTVPLIRASRFSACLGLAGSPSEASIRRRRLLSGQQPDQAQSPPMPPGKGLAAGEGSAWSYTIRGNHTYLPDSRQLFNVFDVQPDPSYRSYWLFANLQLSLDRWPRRLVVAHELTGLRRAGPLGQRCGLAEAAQAVGGSGLSVCASVYGICWASSPRHAARQRQSRTCSACFAVQLLPCRTACLEHQASSLLPALTGRTCACTQQWLRGRGGLGFRVWGCELCHHSQGESHSP